MQSIVVLVGILCIVCVLVTYRITQRALSGPQGTDGPVGIQGPSGKNSDYPLPISGNQGLQGQQGPIGPPGNPPSTPGVQGSTGPTGNAGPRGLTGQPGGEYTQESIVLYTTQKVFKLPNVEIAGFPSGNISVSMYHRGKFYFAVTSDSTSTLHITNRTYLETPVWTTVTLPISVKALAYSDIGFVACGDKQSSNNDKFPICVSHDGLTWTMPYENTGIEAKLYAVSNTFVAGETNNEPIVLQLIAQDHVSLITPQNLNLTKCLAIYKQEINIIVAGIPINANGPSVFKYDTSWTPFNGTSVQTVSLYHNGTDLISVGQDQNSLTEIRQFSIESKEFELLVNIPLTNTSMSWNGDEWVISGNGDNYVRIYSLYGIDLQLLTSVETQDPCLTIVTDNVWISTPNTLLTGLSSLQNIFKPNTD